MMSNNRNKKLGLNAPFAAAPDEPQADPFRGKAADIVKQAKNHLNKRIDDDKDLRHQRTYSKISKHNYSVRAVALHERDENFGREKLDAAIRIFSTWKLYERGRASNNIVPEAVKNSLQKDYEILIS